MSADLTEKIFVPPLGSKASCILTVFYPPPMLWMCWHLSAVLKCGRRMSQSQNPATSIPIKSLI